MESASAQKQLKYQADAIVALASGLTPEEIAWKPDPENWSVLEVIHHLAYEEINDFRRYFDHILHSPDAPWQEFPPLDSLADAESAEHALQERLMKFQSERERSLAWLAGLDDVDWDAAAETPWGAKMTAGDMLASWLAHDLLHVRQLVELRYALTAAASQPYSIKYAGEW